MVDAEKNNNTMPARRNLNRFSVWSNKLELNDNDLPKINDIKANISRIDFKNKDTCQEKVFEARVMTRERYVTKGYLERKKKNPVFDFFGLQDRENPVFENS